MIAIFHRRRPVARARSGMCVSASSGAVRYRVWALVLGAVVLAAPQREAIGAAMDTAMNVGMLVEAGATLRFERYDAGPLFPYEPVSGNLILRNKGGAALEYKAALLGDGGLVMRIAGTGGVLEVPMHHGSVRRMGPVALDTLEPGEERARWIQFPTARSPLVTPGSYELAFALTEHGDLPTPVFTIDVATATGADEAALQAMRALAPNIENPVDLTEHLARDPDTAYMERVGAVIRAHPDSRYAAWLARGFAGYLSVIGGPNSEALQQEYLNVASGAGSIGIAHSARLRLCVLARSEGRMDDLREELADLENSPVPRVKSRALRLMSELGVPGETPGPMLGHASPEATARIIEREGEQIVAGLQAYFDALSQRNAVALADATGLEAGDAEQLLGRFDQELVAKGYDGLVGVDLSGLVLNERRLQAVGMEPGLYSLVMDGVFLTLSRGDDPRTVPYAKTVHLRRDPAGAWTVVMRP